MAWKRAIEIAQEGGGPEAMPTMRDTARAVRETNALIEKARSGLTPEKLAVADLVRTEEADSRTRRAQTDTASAAKHRRDKLERTLEKTQQCARAMHSLGEEGAEAQQLYESAATLVERLMEG